MHFERPEAVWLILLLPLLMLALAFAIHSFSKFGKVPNLQDFLRYSKVPAWRRRLFVYASYLLAIGLCIFALSEPYIYIEAKDKQYSNVRIIFVTDVSRSMAYAEDVKPSRLMAARHQIKEFYDSLDGVYECSILPFAGDVNPYFCPFTTTKLSFLGSLDDLDWQAMPMRGTDLTAAVNALKDVYIKIDKVDESGLNIVVLLSDGGREEALATNRIKLLQTTRELAAKNFRIYTVGVGGDKAAPLIVRDEKGGFIRYIRDDNNRIMTSLLDKEILEQVAENGNGRYYSLNASSTLAYDLQKIIEENRKLVSEKSKLEKFHLQPYLFSVTVCLLMACLLLNKV